MTQEKAISRIQEILYYMESLDADEEELKDIEALRMAIEALQKEPCEDCISRQRVLDIVEFNRNSYDGNDAVVWIEREIKELPSVQPEQLEKEDK